MTNEQEPGKAGMLSDDAAIPDAFRERFNRAETELAEAEAAYKTAVAVTEEADKARKAARETMFGEPDGFYWQALKLYGGDAIR